MIVARNPKEGKQIEKEFALKGIREYIKVFCGEDVAKGIKEDECFALMNDEADTEVNEAVVGDHIFSRYLTESTGIRYIAEADNADNDDDDDIDLDDGDDYLDIDYGHDDDEDDEDDEDDDEKADAFYVLYGLKIKGLKETTVSDALKQWGSNFLKGFGVKIDSLWGPDGSGEVHTIGGLVKGLRGLFGAIDDPEELADRVQK